MTPDIVYHNIFVKNRDGEEILADLCKLFYDRPSYEKGDATHTAYREGQRSVIAFLLRKAAITNTEETDA